MLSFILGLLVVATIVFTIIYIVLIDAGEYPITGMKKFRVIEYTDGYGAKTYYVQFRTFIGLWHYIGSCERYRYPDKEDANTAIKRIRLEQEDRKLSKTVSRKIIS